MRHRQHILWVGALAIQVAAAPNLAARVETVDEPGAARTVGSPTLQGLRVATDARERTIDAVRLLGLRKLDEATLMRDLRGGSETNADEGRIGEILTRLDRSGLFSRVAPTLHVPATNEAEEPVSLDIDLVENPYVSDVVLHGAPGFSEDTLIAALLATPPDGSAFPRRSWLAHVAGGSVQPGIIWGGVGRAAERVLSRLFDAGYDLASIRGTWHPDGTLDLEIDEGRIDAVKVQGIPAELQDEVTGVLALQPGQVFLASDVQRALARLRRELPFVSADTRPWPGRLVPQVIEAPRADGGIDLRCVESQSGPRIRPEDGFVELDGHKLVLHLRSSDKVSLSGEIFQITATPVTGVSLDFQGRLQLWDARNRAHLSVDGMRTIVGVTRSDPAAEDEDDWKGEWNSELLGFTLQIPGLRTAELGVQWHRLVDTSDSWRMEDGASYLYQLLLNQPSREYYTRRGFSAYWTGHFCQQLTLGIEYRRDRYGSLEPRAKPIALSGADDLWPNAAIDDGRMGSLLFRAEWSSHRTPLRSVGALVRHTETTLVGGQKGDWRTGLDTLATLEVADPSLGSDARFNFTRLVSDSTLTLATGHDRGLQLRARLAGGNDVPRQKEAALGGWSALRGFEFKEFRGDWSALGSLEYRRECLGGFLDVGTVRQPDGWTGAKVGLGLKLYLGALQVVAAWRTDSRGDASPAVRVFWGRGF